jgi:hypothetical protein
VIVRETYRRSVGFLYLEPAGAGAAGREPVGTAFFVAVDADTTQDKPFVYLVTAQHVILRSRAAGALYMRVNRDGSYEDVLLDPDSWVLHPTTDVAVRRVQDLPERARIRPMLMSLFYDVNPPNGLGIMTGDEIFFVGAFSQSPGIEEIEPIVRFGKVSRLPGEPVPIEIVPKARHLVDAYLVEAFSWGGHSGSPVFAYFAPDRAPWTRLAGAESLEGETRLLGLVSGHFDLDGKVDYLGDAAIGNVALNSGIAIVIPSDAIRDLVMGEELAADRKAPA